MSYISKYPGEEIDAAIEMGKNITISANGWIRLDSTIDAPIDLNTLTSPGNYSMFYWLNGPSLEGTIPSPLNLVIIAIGTDLFQFAEIVGKKFNRVRETGNTHYSDWFIDQTSGSINPGPNPPANPISGFTTWLDTSVPTAVSFKVYMDGQWVETVPSTGMSRELYDPDELATDVFQYIRDSITAAMLTTKVEDFEAHIEDNIIHVTEQDKAKWNSAATQANIDNAISTLIPEINTTINNTVSSDISKVENLTNEINTVSSDLEAHTSNITIHPNETKQLEWDNKAAPDHTHILNNTVEIAPNEIIGELTSDLMPYDVKERSIVVSSDDERLSIQKNPAHNGDRVCVKTENNTVWYQIVDDTKLGSYHQTLINGDPIVIGSVSERYSKVVYGNGVYIALQINADGTPTRYIMRSTNATSWSEVDPGGANGSIWNDIVYGQLTGFMLIGDSKYAHSKDGISWTVDAISSSSPNIKWVSLCYYGTYYSYGYNTSLSQTFLGTWTGLTWSIEQFRLNGTYSETILFAASASGLVFAKGNRVTAKLGQTYTELAELEGSVEKLIQLDHNVIAFTPNQRNTIVGNVINSEEIVNIFVDVKVLNGVCFQYTHSPEDETLVYVETSKSGLPGSWSTPVDAEIDFTDMAANPFGQVVKIYTPLSESNGRLATITRNDSEIEKAFLIMAAGTSQVEWSDIVNTPTTVAGYGITDMASEESIMNLEAYVDEQISYLPSEADFSAVYALQTKYNSITTNLDNIEAAISVLDSTLAELEIIVS